MTNEVFTQILFWGGVVLIVGEFFLPGLIVVFLGLASITVAGLRYFGFIETYSSSFTWFFVLSVIYLLVLRQLITRFLPSDFVREITDEDAVVMGSEVEVTETIIEDDTTGRIRFSGSSWPARSLSGTIEKGSKARIVTKENIAFLVEKV